MYKPDEIRDTRKDIQQDISNPKVLLGKKLEEYFPYTNPAGTFSTYLFSNERNHKNVLKKIMDTEIKVDTEDKIRVAIVFGESNLLSFLPALQKIADLVILADIEVSTAKHTKHLLNCIKNSDNKKTFIQAYMNNHPLEGLKPSYNKRIFSLILDNGMQAGLLGEEYFLASPKKFKACKAAANKLVFSHMQLNLLSENDCGKLAVFLQENNAIFTFCNFSNIHDYDLFNKRFSSVKRLTEFADNSYIMFANTDSNYEKDLLEIKASNPLKFFCHKKDTSLISKLKTEYAVEKYFQKTPDSELLINKQRENSEKLKSLLLKIVEEMAVHDTEFKKKLTSLKQTITTGDFNVLLRRTATSPVMIGLLKYLLKNADTFNIDIYSKGQSSGNVLDVAGKFANEQAIELLKEYHLEPKFKMDSNVTETSFTGP